MLGPGGVLWLLSHEMRLGYRQWQATGKNRWVRRFFFYGLIIAALGFGGYCVARILSDIEPIPTSTALAIAGGVFALLLSFMLSQALMLITEALYQRGDIDLLLASPLPVWRVLIVRMAAIAINVSLLYLVLTGAVFIWLPFFGGWAWMSFAPSILLLALFATGLGLIVARLLFWTIGPKSTRVFAQILAGFIGAAFFIATQLQNFTGDRDRAAMFQALLERLTPMLGDPANVLSLPARAAFGALDAFSLWAIAAVGLYLAAVWWYASRFAVDAASIAGLGARRRRVDGRRRRMRAGIWRSLVRKEWRLLARDPLLLSQILLQMLYLIPLFLVFATRLGDEEIGRIAVAGFSAGFVLLVTSLAASLAWLTVSAEDAPDLIASAPVSRDRVDNAKAFAAALPAAVLLAPPVLGTAIVVSPMAGLWLLLGGAAAILSTCLIAVWHQTPGSRKDFRRRSRGSLMLNFGRVFVSMGWIGATGLAVAGWPLAALLPAISAFGLVLALHESRPRRDPAAIPVVNISESSL